MNKLNIYVNKIYSDFGVFEIYFDKDYLYYIKLPNVGDNNLVYYFNKYFNDYNFIFKEEESNIKKQIKEYLNKERSKFDINIKLYGTDFQKKVLKKCMEIDYGDIKTYKYLGEKIGSNAYRAVGSALGKNPIPLVIPCHRVVGSTGKLVGYYGGVNLKEKLIKMEKDFIN